MANSINVNGCSVCQPGRENYTSFTAKIGRKTVKAKTAAEARRKAWGKFKRRPPKSCFTLMEDRIDE